ncbi:MAG: GDP-mannose 4,6-dehydratase [Armatimonadetes bacterium]|nr:GDP-mannose 4,6-dehydratase [Armatimonadota bacterium]
MRAIIAGGAGFLGSHLADALLLREAEVVAVDNFITGSRQNVAHLDGNRSFSLIEHDICEPFDIPGPVDLVLNFASPASPADFVRYPLEVMRVGSHGTENMLEIARRKNAVFLMASTSEVYGDPMESPQTETYRGNVNPIGPRGVYDEAKRFSEALTMAYHRQQGVKTRIARIFNTYGPRMRVDDERAVPSFLSAAMSNEPLLIQGNGKQTRSFCFVSDLVRGILALSDADYVDPVNIGNDDEISVHQLAQTVIEILGSESEIKYIGAAPDDPQCRKPDLSRAAKILNYAPLVNLHEGLTATIEDFRPRLQAPITR